MLPFLKCDMDAVLEWLEFVPIAEPVAARGLSADRGRTGGAVSPEPQPGREGVRDHDR